MDEHDIALMAREWGFDRVAILPPVRENAWEAAAAARPDMPRHGLAADPVQRMADVRSVVLLRFPAPWYRDFPALCGYYPASQRAYTGARALAEQMRARGVQAVMDAGLPVKPLITRAGWGAYGRHTLIVADDIGTAAAYRVILTDAALTPSMWENECGMSALTMAAPNARMDCGDCMRCVRACPTGALDGRGGMDASRCLRTYMLEGIPVPPSLRAHMGTRFLGCDVCQRACPRNAVAPRVPVPEEVRTALSRTRLLSLDAAERADNARRLAQLLGTNLARARRIDAQAALTAGNLRWRPALSLLREWAARGDTEAVRAHAAWAISRIMGERPSNA